MAAHGVKREEKPKDDDVVDKAVKGMSATTAVLRSLLRKDTTTSNETDESDKKKKLRKI